VLAKIRLRLPDRPGSLGRVASAIGAAGGDIAAVDVLGSEAGQVLDDVLVAVREVRHLDRVVTELSAVPGVAVVGLHHPEPAVPGHAELQLAAQVLAAPARALRTLVDGAPVALGVDWAVVLQAATQGETLEPVVAGAGAPAALPTLGGPLRSRALVTGSAAAALVPLGTSLLALLVGREGGLAFHRRELWRLEQLGAVVSSVVPVPAQRP
jgi:hypothetical protein